MRCFEKRAELAAAALGVKRLAVLDKLKVEEACRIHARLRRYHANHGSNPPLEQRMNEIADRELRTPVRAIRRGER